MGKTVRRAVGAGVLAGIAYAIWRMWKARVPDRPGDLQWETAPFPFPPVPRPAQPQRAPETEPAPVPAASNGHDPWVEPADDGSCPISHPVKAKLSSGIFHVPGGANYDRTKADRCYADAEAAEADGHRPSKH